jgi:signal peptidase I
MPNDPAGPDDLTGRPQPPAEPAPVAPAQPDGDVSPYTAFAPPPAPLAAPVEARVEAASMSEPAAHGEVASPIEPNPAEAAGTHLQVRPLPELASAPEFAPHLASEGPPTEAPTLASPHPIDVWPPPEPVDPYADVPASLELSYTSEDVGLSPKAYDRTYPYEAIQKKRRRTNGTRARKVGRELAETVILALLIFFAVKAVVQNFRVEGASMEPTMHNNQYLLVNKALYFRLNLDRVHDILPFVPGGNDSEHHLFRAPRRGDIIVFKFPLDPSRDFIKRVIGVPGDTVEVRDETVFINGSPLKEDYIKDKPNYTYAPKTVPAGMYYVLGDNRRNSFDSHAWGNSCSPQQLCDFVPEENIIGQAWVSYWPFDQLGFIPNKVIRPQAP